MMKNAFDEEIMRYDGMLVSVFCKVPVCFLLWLSHAA
jgi:hypothetical protein